MPQKQKSKSWSQLKEAGNQRFRTGQYGDATALYSQAIRELEKCSQRDPEDLGVLYSNRAASFLKDGNCGECLKDCNTSLDLFPYNVKSLLRRAAAYEALERYRPAYVDYKTALQIDCRIAAAHEGTNRMTKALTEADGPSWRQKLPPIPSVPLAVRQNLNQKAANGVQKTSSAAPSEKDRRRSQALKDEGNALVKKGDHTKAIDKYSQSLKLNPTEASTYTNRALCYLSIKQFKDAIRDCDEALMIDSSNVKALYRRAQAHKELKDSGSCAADLNRLLKVEPKNSAAQKLLQDVQKL